MMKTAINVIAILVYTVIGAYFGGSSITRVNIEDKVAKLETKKDSLSRLPPEYQYRPVSSATLISRLPRKRNVLFLNAPYARL